MVFPSFPGEGQLHQQVRWGHGRQLKDPKGLHCGCLHLQFSSLQKEIEERTNDIELLKAEQMKLQGVIKSLEKDIQGLKREIQERDETIQDKVRTALCPPQTLPRGTQSPGLIGPWLLKDHLLDLAEEEGSVKSPLCVWHGAS